MFTFNVIANRLGLSTILLFISMTTEMQNLKVKPEFIFNLSVPIINTAGYQVDREKIAFSRLYS